jgi:L-seryl-tRNA(Ser) seleniumtransferase
LKVVVRAVIDEARAEVRAGNVGAIDEHEAARRAAARAPLIAARKITRVINATGVILHTNLGRAPLSRAAIEALSRTSGNYASVELDLATGKRGGRGAFVEEALTTLKGAEAALVVNNNAAAVLLALAASALGKSVVVSRGELIEIGGGFRVPEVLARSGAKLVEVGTTNRTRVADYARALEATPDAVAILRIHPGNFRQIGFVERPTLAELTALGRERNVTVLEDLGGGALVDLASTGLDADPIVAASIAAGADLVTFSTDKILGGPQGGVIVGKKALVDRARKDPLARALRMGRLPLVALEATLDAYLAEDLDAIPALRMARLPASLLRERVARWASALGYGETTCVSSVSGGGTYAGDEIPSWALALRVPDAPRFVAQLRAATPSVIARIAEDTVLFDARTVAEDEDEALLAAIRYASCSAEGSS